ncbi:hypothetical protein [Streptomyces sp. NBC_00162]|uniref:hypothetical protein n=1 Tax=Streptomyces sp. NBC_00162 TaxID=2903629 RepID=UPI00214AE19E|nr:hypothetical protein [Streptomyces sp. NBC_00162]UUU37600.1 hypothetical protein JIW86_00835 [Streptomyces sp. NBC_00162]
MNAPTNTPKPTRWNLAQPGYGIPSPELLARSDQGLARFLGHTDEGHDENGREDGGAG